jgi:hypothetical protein
MYYEGKIQTKIDIFEEKKTPLIKIINNFLKEMKDKISKKNLEYNEFFALCQIGLSEYARQKIWPILIGNKCGITNTFYDSLRQKITQINNFDELEKKYKENSSIRFVENYNLNKMIKDIIKIKYLFLNEIEKGEEEPDKQKKIMSKVFSICRCFFSHRYDIPYNKNIIPLIYTLLLKNIDEETAFISVYNIICSNTSVSKSYLWKEKKKNLKNLEIFFEIKFKEYLPRLSQYFKKLDITCDLYLYDWIESLFTQSLDSKIAEIIIDSYLIFGEYVLIQTSIVILKILEEELSNFTAEEIFQELRKPLKTSVVEFFDIYRNYVNI